MRGQAELQWGRASGTLTLREAQPLQVAFEHYCRPPDRMLIPTNSGQLTWHFVLSGKRRPCTSAIHRPLDTFIIDFVRRDQGSAARYEAAFEFLRKHVPPDRSAKHFAGYPFWQLWRPRPEMYSAIAGLTRFLVTPHVAKHRLFAWTDACVLQELATWMDLPIHVCHFPPGTSKWNKIEHRMFCHITQNWRGRPLVSHEVMINLIANTTTQRGLRVRAELDQAAYPLKTKVTDAELAAIKLKRHEFHGDWNYSIRPSN